MVVGFTTTCAISAYHHWWCEFEILIRSSCITLCVKVCQWLATGRLFSPGHLVSSTNKTDRHDITEILLKVALNTIKQTNKKSYHCGVNCLNIEAHEGFFLLWPAYKEILTDKKRNSQKLTFSLSQIYHRCDLEQIWIVWFQSHPYVASM